MDPVEVDTIGFQPLEARLDRADHILTVVAGSEHMGVGLGAECIFARYNEFVAVVDEEVADNRLRLPKLITIRRIDEIAPGVGIGFENSSCFARLDPIAPGSAEQCAAQSEL